MTETTIIDNQINQYLAAVRQQLSGLSREEIDSILDDLREHIDASLQSLGSQPTLENVKAVLASMDPPESFAPEFEETKKVEAKVSRLAIIGAVLLPFGILMAILLLIPVSSATYSVIDGVNTSDVLVPTWWQWLLRFTILPLGIVSVFGTTILGWISLSQIRASKGTLIGRPLALIDALFYPLLAFDGLLLVLLFAIIARIPDGQLALTEMLALLSYILVIILDLMIIAIAWRKIR